MHNFGFSGSFWVDSIYFSYVYGFMFHKNKYFVGSRDVLCGTDGLSLFRVTLSWWTTGGDIICGICGKADLDILPLLRLLRKRVQTV